MAVEDSGQILESAGNWTLGVSKGLMITFLPVLAFSIGVGIMMKVAKIGVRIGGGS